MKCACEFDPETGAGRKMCVYHERAFKFLAKSTRDTERKRVGEILDAQAARSSAKGDEAIALILRSLSRQVVHEKSLIKVPLLQPNAEDLRR